MNQRRQFIAASASITLATLATPARAAPAWPTRPLRIVIPFAAGGTSDVIARLISKPLGDALGVSVLVENKPGNNANLGAAAVALSTDQHTVLLSDVGSLAINPLINKDLAFKPEDLKGVTMLAYSPHLLVVTPSVPASNIAELVAFSKKTRLNVASAGNGSPNHLGVVEIALQTGMRWQHIPYKGGAQALADTAGGTTHMVLNGMLATLPLVQAGRLKAIGVSKRTRMAQLSQLPTIAEQGVPQFESGTYQGVVAPSTMPQAAVDRLNAELIKVIRSPELRAKLVEAGAEVQTSTPADATDFILKERKRWSTVIQRAGKELEGSA